MPAKWKYNIDFMEKKNKYMEVSYQLFVDGEQGLEMMEEGYQGTSFSVYYRIRSSP